MTLIASSGAMIVSAAAAWTLVDSMNPSTDVISAGAPIEVDLGKLEPGQQIVVIWRGRPILVTHRTTAALAELRKPELIALLSDPGSGAPQQPAYAQNWHRSLKPDIGVLVGICTHLGCLPTYYPKPNDSVPVDHWPGGYFCPCHGSKYDLVGRVYSGVPAPYNLPVPPYHYVNDQRLRVGENPAGHVFSLSSVAQI